MFFSIFVTFFTILYNRLSAKLAPLMFVQIDALHLSQYFFSDVVMFSWVEPVLSYEDKESCSRVQHHINGGI